MLFQRLPMAVVFCSLLLSRVISTELAAEEVRDADLGKTNNVHVCGNIYLAGQPTRGDIQILKQKGIRRVITLRAAGEVPWSEDKAMRAAGLEFISIPIRSAESLTDQVFQQIRKLLSESEETPTLLHCAAANRVGAVWLAHRVLDQNVPLESAIKDARLVGLKSRALEAKARSYIERMSVRNQEVSVRPGINDSFVKPDLDVSSWLGRFEVESREVFAARREVLRAVGLTEGAEIADVGAGTGFFARLFADEVGHGGWVYAVDIAPRFLQHITQKAREENVLNITAVLGSDRSIALPPGSVDCVFTSDTYHHFEFPASTLASIHRALRKGGILIVVDFERIPGRSREFILNHVRAGKQEVRGEIEAAGFEFLEEESIDGFRENYFLRFRRK